MQNCSKSGNPPERPNQIALAGVLCLCWWEGDFPTAMGSLKRCAQLPRNLKASRQRSPARGALVARPVHRVVRLELSYFRTTMSAFVVPTISNSSFCSAAGTLNLSRDFLNSLAITSHSFSLMFR